MPRSMLLLVPPVVLTLLVVLVWLFSAAVSPLAARRKGPRGALDKPYAGGENLETHRVQPDYSQFFPFAFFFTILHVVTLIVATSPGEVVGSLAFAVVYVLGALLALFILFRR
jgi:NADH:ubiquinone oxidoreductase subunit 3 (subunit A)